MYYGVSFPLCEETHLEVPEKRSFTIAKVPEDGPGNGTRVVPLLYLAVYPCFSPSCVSAVRCRWQLVQWQGAHFSTRALEAIAAVPSQGALLIPSQRVRLAALCVLLDERKTWAELSVWSVASAPGLEKGGEVAPLANAKSVLKLGESISTAN